MHDSEDIFSGIGVSNDNWSNALASLKLTRATFMPDHRFHQAGCHGDDGVPSGMGPHLQPYFYCTSALNDDGGILKQNNHCHLGNNDR